MTTCEFYAPTQIIASDDSTETLAKILRKEEPKSIAVLVDRNVLFLPPIQRIIECARELSGQLKISDIDSREPDTDFVDQQVEIFKGNPPDLLVGIGGGSTLDLGKAVSVLAFNPGKAETYQGRELVSNPGCCTVMIPTTAGTGSEVTPGAVVFNPRTKRKGAIWSPFIIPQHAILDAELTLSMPAKVAAATGMDALAHSVESFTARRASVMSRMYSVEAFRLIKSSLPGILRNGNERDLRRQQLLGASLAGIAACNSDTGACHSIAYALGIYFGVPHGVAIALLLPHVLAVNIRKGARDYVRLATVLLGDEDRLSDEEKCWALHRFIADLVPPGTLSVSLRDFGVQSEDLPELAQRGLDLKTALSNNPVEFTVEDTRHVLQQLVEV